MGEIKPVSFRIGEEEQEKFKKYAAENGFNQAEAFKSIMSMLELENAKNTLGDRSKSVDAFRETADKLINFYLNALEENVTTEDRIREELSKEIKVKEDTILNIMDQLNELKDLNAKLKDDLKALEEINNNLKEEITKVNTELQDKHSQVDMLNRNNSTLQEQLNEYKGYKETNKELEKQIEELKVLDSNRQKDFDDVINKNKQYEDKIKNDKEMLDFYKNNNMELKDTLRELEEKYSKDIADIKDGYNKDIINIKEDYKKGLEKELKALEDNLKNKYELELSRKDLEIEKLKISIEQFGKRNNSTKRAKKSE